VSKQRNIRVRGVDRELIQKLNKRVSSKKSRLRKKGIEIDEFQTQGVTTFNTRAEFNAYVQRMERFTNPHNLNHQYLKTANDLVLTKKEVNEYERQIKRINAIKARKQKEIEKLNVRNLGADTGTTVGKMGAYTQNKKFGGLTPLTKNIDVFQSREDFKKYIENMKENFKGDFLKKRDALYKENYLKAIANIHGTDSKLYKIVDKTSIKRFMNLYYTENLTEMTYLYDPNLRNAIHDEVYNIFKEINK
jgi:hypothetical protein